MRRTISKFICVLTAAALGASLLMALSSCNPPRNKEAVRIIAHYEQKKVLDPFFEEFMKLNPDIEVEVLYGVDQDTQMHTDLPPDLLFVSELTAQLYEDELLDLNELLTDEEKEHNLGDFLGTTLEAMTFSGKLLALPLHANVSLLYYNIKLFDAKADEIKAALGRDSHYPDETWTWEDFEKAGRILTVFKDNKVEQWGCTTINTWWGEWLIYVRQMGGDFMTDDGTLTMKTPEFKAGMEFFKRKCTGETAFAYNPTDTRVGISSLGGFVGRRTAMEIGGHTGNWVSYNDFKNFDWDVTTIPKPVGKPDAKGAEVAVEGYGIYKNALNKEKALRVLKYFYSKEGREALAKLNKIVPTKSFRDLILSTPKEQRANPKNMEAVFKGIEEGMRLPRHPAFEQGASSVILNDLNKYLNGTYQTVDAFVNAATITVQSYINTFK